LNTAVVKVEGDETIESRKENDHEKADKRIDSQSHLPKKKGGCPRGKKHRYKDAGMYQIGGIHSQ
jgi:hypothetical protein